MKLSSSEKINNHKLQIMKKLCLLLAATLFFACAPMLTMAQEDATVEEDNTVYTAYDEAPVFKGGTVGISQFVGTNLKFPKKARKENVTGDVVVEFVIEKDGSVGDVNITTSLTPECDQAVVDMVKKMPKWTPARKDNKDVRSLYTMPVSFKFDDGSTPAAPQQ